MPQGADEQLALVDAVLEAQRYRKALSEYETLGASLFGAQWQGERSDWPVLAGLLRWIVDLYREVGEGQLPEGLIDYLAGDPAIAGLEQKISETEGALVDYGSAFDALTELLELAGGRRASLMEQPLTTQESIFEAWHRNLDRLRSLVTYNQLSEILLHSGFQCD